MHAPLGLLLVFAGFSAFAGTRGDAVPLIPLGFEQAGDSYAARAMGHLVRVGAGGATIRSSRGSLRIALIGRRAHATLHAEGDAGTQNSFVGNDPSAWRFGVPLFQRVRAGNVYPGIDVIYYGRDAALEYDFVVASGADARRIRLTAIGADSLALDGSGDLRIRCGSGEIRQRRPIAYQYAAGLRREVAARFVLDSARGFHFALGDYDHRVPLTIDPALSYSSFLGGTATDEAHATAVDATGDLYIAGRTFSTANSNSNVLLLKVTPAGAVVHSIFGGTTGDDSANAIVTDSTGDVYLAGSTSSTDFPLNGSYPSYQAGLEGLQNAFVLALNPANTGLIFSTYFGGSYSDQALGMAIGPDNDLYIVGDTTSPNLTVVSSTTAPFQATNRSGGLGYDAFLVSFTSLGAPNYGTYIGGSSDDHAYAVAVDSSGDVYVVGTTASSDFPVSPYPGFPEPFQLELHGVANAFAIEFLPNLQEASWSTYIGGESSDAANAVVLDASGNIYIAGTTGSVEFPVSTGAYQTAYQGGASDGFLISLQNSGQFGNWSTYLGSAGADVINGLAIDSSGNLYVAGATDSASFPVTSDAVQSANAGGQDAILMKLNGAGSSLLFSSYLGGSGNDVATAVTVDASGHIYMVGITASSNNDFPITSGAYQQQYGGGSSDGFFAVFGCSSAVPAIGTGGVVNGGSFASGIAPGSAIAIFGTNLSCTAGSAATVPLSTSLGSVSVDVNGAAVPLFYVGEGQINAQLPYGTALGSALITVTNPSGTSAAVSVPVIAAAPGIFLVNGRSATLNQDYSLNTATNPAKVASIVSVYFTGEGPLSGTLTTGAVTPAPPPLFTATLPNSATVGGVNAIVSFMGAAPGLVGVGQANITIPALTSGDYPLVLTIGGVASAPATISVTE